MAALVHPIRATKCAAAVTERQRTSVGTRRHSPIAAPTPGQAGAQYRARGCGPRVRPALPRRSGSSEQAKARPRLAPGSETSSWFWCWSPALRRVPIVDVLADLILGQTVALLDLALELITAAANDVEIVVGELAPLLLHLPFDLLPISLHAIPVHFERTSCSSFAGKTQVSKKCSQTRELLLTSSVLRPLTRGRNARAECLLASTP